MKLNRRDFLASSLAALSASCATTPRAGVPAAMRRPNIVVILADDMGVGDVQALWPASKIPTPHLDHFAAESMCFTDAHSGSAVCTPTRYGLLTGRYAWRTCLQEWVIDAYEPPLIAANRLTLPGMLREQGYRTACIGKWHLGCRYEGPGVAREKKLDITAPVSEGPTTRGFDYYFGTDVPNFPPFTFIENDRYLIPPTASSVKDEQIRIWFEGYPMAPGWQFDQILPTLTERAVGYIHERAGEEEPFFLYFPMTSPHEPISPSAPFQGKSGIAPVADFIMETDWSAGQVLKALEDTGVADDTLVIFATDNGHGGYTGWEMLEAAGHAPSGPWRGKKADIWEGGHRVPFIARWPGMIKPGTQCDALVCLNDLMATCAAVTGAVIPDNAAEDSISLLPLLTGESEAPLRETLVNHDVKGNFALREGDWKLAILRGDGDLLTSYHLFNLQDDPGETQNLAQVEPARVQSMRQHLEEIVAAGRSTPGPRQPNDTLEIDLYHVPKQRWATPIDPDESTAGRGAGRL